MSSTRERKSYKFLSLFDIPNSVIKAIPPFISIITFHSPIINSFIKEVYIKFY